MRTIGVLGGMGPQATMDFEARVHAAAQQVVPQHVNEGYPPMVTLYLRHAPVLVGPDGIPKQPLKLDPRTLDAVAQLGRWADLLVIIANTPHFFLEQLRAMAGCEVLSIVDVTVEELRRRGGGPVGLVGLGVPQVYVERFEQEGFEVHLPIRHLRDRLDNAILRLMEGTTTAEHRGAARAAIGSVRNAGATATVLGCTEVPLLLGDSADADDLVNPTELLAQAVVRRAAE
jgi:aspartate racemase